MISYSVEKEYQGMVDAYEKAGGDRSVLLNKDVARLVIHENKVLSADGVEGIQIETKETKSGVDIYLLVEKGAWVVHCGGELQMWMYISSAKVSHCVVALPWLIWTSFC